MIVPLLASDYPPDLVSGWKVNGWQLVGTCMTGLISGSITYNLEPLCRLYLLVMKRDPTPLLLLRKKSVSLALVSLAPTRIVIAD